MPCTVRGSIKDAATNANIPGAVAKIIDGPVGYTITCTPFGSYTATFPTGTAVGYVIEGSHADYITNQRDTGPMTNGQVMNGFHILLTHV